MSAADVIAEALLRGGAAPGSSLHSWRCEYPDQYGPCRCVPETVVEILADLSAAGYVVATPEEIRAWPVEQQAELIGGEARTCLIDVTDHAGQPRRLRERNVVVLGWVDEVRDV